MMAITISFILILAATVGVTPTSIDDAPTAPPTTAPSEGMPTNSTTASPTTGPPQGTPDNSTTAPPTTAPPQGTPTNSTTAPPTTGSPQGPNDNSTTAPPTTAPSQGTPTNSTTASPTTGSPQGPNDNSTTAPPTTTAIAKPPTSAIEATPQPPCPDFDKVWSEAGEKEVNICWTMKGNWNESGAKYQIKFHLQLKISIEHDGVGHCQRIAYNDIALDRRTIVYNVTLNWRHCQPFKSFTRPEPTPTPTAKPTPIPTAAGALKANNENTTKVAIAFGAICLALLLFVVIYRNKERLVSLWNGLRHRPPASQHPEAVALNSVVTAAPGEI